MNKTTSKQTGTNGRSALHVKAGTQLRNININELHSVDGFATRYGQLKRGEPFKTQWIYNNMDLHTMVLTVHGVNFPIIQIDKVKLIVWDGKS